MKCLCKRECQDKETKEMYAEGRVYCFTNERAEEVCKTPYFEKIKEVEVVKEVVKEVEPKEEIKEETKVVEPKEVEPPKKKATKKVGDK